MKTLLTLLVLTLTLPATAAEPPMNTECPVCHKTAIDLGLSFDGLSFGDAFAHVVTLSLVGGDVHEFCEAEP